MLIQALNLSGPFPSGKLEIDADPAEVRGPIWQSANERFTAELKEAQTDGKLGKTAAWAHSEMLARGVARWTAMN